MPHPRQHLPALAAKPAYCLTPISHHLLEDETAYILGNCEAKLFITSKKLELIGTKTAQKATTVSHFYMLDGTTDQYQSFDDLLASCPTTPIEDEILGTSMLYSSGTTGQPYMI